MKRYKAPPPQSRIEQMAPLLILAAALAIRLLYLLQIDSIPTFYFPIMDEGYHVALAQQIRAGTVAAEPFYRAPLYPYLLAMFFTITGNSLFWTRMIQIVLGSFLPLVVFALGLRLFQLRVALWAAIVAVLYPTFLYYDATLLITSLMVLLTTLLVWQLYRTENYLTTVNCVMSGVLLGLAGLARPNILLLGPALLIWIVIVVRPKVGLQTAIVRYATIGLAAVVVVAPVTLHNYAVGKDTVLIAWQGGFNFFLGNNDQASGWSATAPGIDATWQGGYEQSIAIAEQAAGHRLKRSEVSDYWYDRAWVEIGQSPGHFLALQAKKLRLFLNGYEIPNNQDIYVARDYASILKPLLWKRLIYFPYGLLAPLAVMGFVLSLRQWRKYLIVYLALGSYVFSLMLFFVCARYRQPLLPLMILLAAYGVIELVRLARERNWRKFGLIALVPALLLVESNHDLLHLNPNRVEAENHVIFGNAYKDQNNVGQAVAEYRAAIAADPTYALAENNLGLLFARRGNRPEAEVHFRNAIANDPQTIETFYNLATLYLEQGRTQAAITLLRKGAQLHPYDDYMALKLGMTYYEAGDLEAAWRAVQRSLQLNPDNAQARNIAAQIRNALDTSSTSPPPTPKR